MGYLRSSLCAWIYFLQDCGLWKYTQLILFRNSSSFYQLWVLGPSLPGQCCQVAITLSSLSSAAQRIDMDCSARQHQKGSGCRLVLLLLVPFNLMRYSVMTGLRRSRGHFLTNHDDNQRFVQLQSASTRILTLYYMKHLGSFIHQFGLVDWDCVGKHLKQLSALPVCHHNQDIMFNWPNDIKKTKSLTREWLGESFVVGKYTTDHSLMKPPNTCVHMVSHYISTKLVAIVCIWGMTGLLCCMFFHSWYKSRKDASWCGDYQQASQYGTCACKNCPSPCIHFELQRLVLYKLTFCICRLVVITLDLLSVLSLDDNITLTSLDWLRAQSVCRQIPHEWW